MPSPFPGMDPWLEGETVFPDLHDGLIFLLKEALNAVLPPAYNATTKSRIWIDDTHYREPDVNVHGINGHESGPLGIGGGQALAMLTGTGLLHAVLPASDPSTESYLEIRANHGKRLVTAIEILSPTNKRSGEGRTAYLQKQLEYRAAAINVVEIDLLRGGTHTTLFPESKLPPTGTYDYHACIYVPAAVPQCFLVAIRLTDRLPSVIVPLDFDVDPVTVDLQVLFDRCYSGGRYASLVRYTEPPNPPLTAEQAEWATGVLRAKGVLA